MKNTDALASLIYLSGTEGVAHSKYNLYSLVSFPAASSFLFATCLSHRVDLGYALDKRLRGTTIVL